MNSPIRCSYGTSICVYRVNVWRVKTLRGSSL